MKGPLGGTECGDEGRIVHRRYEEVQEIRVQAAMGF